jgi:hypothetical protein
MSDTGCCLTLNLAEWPNSATHQTTPPPPWPPPAAGGVLDEGLQRAVRQRQGAPRVGGARKGGVLPGNKGQQLLGGGAGSVGC